MLFHYTIAIIDLVACPTVSNRPSHTKNTDFLISLCFHIFPFKKEDFFCLIGKYIYLEGYWRSTGDNALLLSPVFNNSNASGSCFTFWYRMYRSYGGILNVYLENTMTAEGEKLVWSLSGNKGYRWFKGEVNIRSPTGTYQVHLQLFN